MKDKNIRNILITSTGVIVLGLMLIFFYYYFNDYSVKDNEIIELVKSKEILDASNEINVDSAVIRSANDYSINLWIYVSNFEEGPKVILRRKDNDKLCPKIMIAPKTNDLIIEVSSNSFDSDSEPTPKPTEPQNTWAPYEADDNYCSFTTAAPTTEAPTTEAPTTEAPTTEAPTTEAPTTEAPTTEAPTTETPTTEAPTTEAPTTEAPTTEAPTTQPPVVKNLCKITKCLRASERKKKCKGWEVVEKSNKGKNHWKPLWTKFNCDGSIKFGGDEKDKCGKNKQKQLCVKKPGLEGFENYEKLKTHRYRIRNIPMQKWLNLNISVGTNNVDIFINRKLKGSFIVPGIIPSPTGTLKLCPNGGFQGFLSKPLYSNKQLDIQKINKIYMEGPYESKDTETTNWLKNLYIFGN